MALRIFEPEEVQEPAGLVMVLYGGSDVGKTTLACSGASVLHQDFDRKAYRAARRAQRIEFINWIQDRPSKEELAGLLADKTITAIDTVGRMLECMMSGLIADNPDNARKSGEPSRQGYGALKSTVMSYMRDIQEAKPGINILLLAHSTEEIGAKDQLVEKLYISGGFRNESGWLSDQTGLMIKAESDPDANGETNVERYVDFRYKQGRSVKDNAGLGLVKLGDPNDSDVADMLFSKLGEGIMEAQRENAAVSLRRKKLTEAVGNVTGPEDLTSLAKVAAEEPPALKKIIANRAAAEGWTWQNGQFQA